MLPQLVDTQGWVFQVPEHGMGTAVRSITMLLRDSNTACVKHNKHHSCYPGKDLCMLAVGYEQAAL